MPRRTWTHKHGSSQTAPYWVLGSECEVVVVGNYKFADSFTRYLHLGMHLEFCDTRRNHVAPRTPYAKRPIRRCQENMVLNRPDSRIATPVQGRAPGVWAWMNLERYI